MPIAAPDFLDTENDVNFLFKESTNGKEFSQVPVQRKKSERSSTGVAPEVKGWSATHKKLYVAYRIERTIGQIGCCADKPDHFLKCHYSEIFQLPFSFLRDR